MFFARIMHSVPGTEGRSLQERSHFSLFAKEKCNFPRESQHKKGPLRDRAFKRLTLLTVDL